MKTLASTINPSSYKLSGSDVADFVSIYPSADEDLYSSSSANYDAAPPNDPSLGSSGVKTLASNINPSAGKFLGSDIDEPVDFLSSADHALFSGRSVSITNPRSDEIPGGYWWQQSQYR